MCIAIRLKAQWNHRCTNVKNCILLICMIYTRLMNTKWYPVTMSTTLLRRWYYVNAVPTTLILSQSGSYYVVARFLSRSLVAMLQLRKF